MGISSFRILPNDRGYAPYRFYGKLNDACKTFESMIKLAHNTGDIRRYHFFKTNLAWVQTFKGKFKNAEKALKENMIFHREDGDVFLEGNAGTILALNYYANGKFEECKEISDKLYEIGKKNNILWTLFPSFMYHGLYHFSKSEYDKASQYLNDSYEGWERIKVFDMMLLALDKIAKVAISSSNFKRAEEAIIETLHSVKSENEYMLLLPSLESLALLLFERSNLDLSLKVFANCQRIRKELELPILRSEEYLYSKITDLLPDVSTPTNIRLNLEELKQISIHHLSG